MRPRINTHKHITQVSLFAVASGAVATVNIIIAAAVLDRTDPREVAEGATISAVYVEMWLTSDDTAAGTAIVTLEKRVSGHASMTAAQSALLNDYDNKKNVFYTFQGLVGPNVQVPMPAIRGWFKIPKGKQRFGLGDTLSLNVHGQSNGLAGCGFNIYKEQT